MKLYIDPGTGSMLFAILIGILGAANYLLKDWIVKIRFLLSGGRQKADVNEKKIPIVIFSDDKRYWTVFEPLCREFDRRGVDIVYMTASPDDPALKNPYEHIKGEFIGENNKAFAKLNFLNATLVLSTTPGLDVYQWKRSKKVQYYVHMLHAANEIAGYRMFGTDYYDALLLSGEYQVRDVRYLESIRNLPEKEIVKIGIPYLDEMYARLHKAQNADIKSGKKERTVLLAPSWGKSAILSKFGERIIDVLIETGYSIIIRPHPQSFTSEREMLDTLMEKYPNSEKLEWNRDNDNFEVLKRADILISDFSGVVFDFSLVHEKPVIYTDTKFDKGPYDAWWLKTPYWTFTALPRIGQELNEENLDSLKEMIDSCLSDEKYAQGRQEVIRETWEHRGEGTQRAVDYILSKYEQLKSAEEEK
ncbi:CDP-glycerol glycerophosphotransferase family protein [Blautia argi]|uniref:CDP-glycerol--glycerophosphate glycerophosphotransferase n=1 Tax=Blautia argi TaxID=1912897 RepID=A0A2Z4U9B8_9FIRM|nr:CDP-glycerol glycerophosphotransferase family protein [Blautia argi]AWY97600.1 CDP-glycerol--glycerophosphate glycerophosphotransferase [Blautia argi]